MFLRHCHLSLVKRMLFGLSGFHNWGSSKKNGYGPRIITSWATVLATRDVLEREDTRHMYVPNCARRPSTGKLNRCRAQNKRWLPPSDLFQEAKNSEYGTGIKNGHLDLHRQVDAQGFVLAETAAVSARSATPPIGKHFTTNAYQNPSQSRIRGLNRPERDAIENYCCRVFVDSTWTDDHRSTQRHVPLGKAEPQESER